MLRLQIDVRRNMRMPPVISHPGLRAPWRKISADEFRAKSVSLRTGFADGITRLTDSRIYSRRRSASKRFPRESSKTKSRKCCSLSGSSPQPRNTTPLEMRGRHLGFTPALVALPSRGFVTVGENRFREDTANSELWAPTGTTENRAILLRKFNLHSATDVARQLLSGFRRSSSLYNHVSFLWEITTRRANELYLNWFYPNEVGKRGCIIREASGY